MNEDNDPIKYFKTLNSINNDKLKCRVDPIIYFSLLIETENFVKTVKIKNGLIKFFKFKLPLKKILKRIFELKNNNFSQIFLNNMANYNELAYPLFLESNKKNEIYNLLIQKGKLDICFDIFKNTENYSFLIKFLEKFSELKVKKDKKYDNKIKRLSLKSEKILKKNFSSFEKYLKKDDYILFKEFISLNKLIEICEYNQIKEILQQKSRIGRKKTYKTLISDEKEVLHVKNSLKKLSKTNFDRIISEIIIIKNFRSIFDGIFESSVRPLVPLYCILISKLDVLYKEIFLVYLFEKLEKLEIIVNDEYSKDYKLIISFIKSYPESFQKNILIREILRKFFKRKNFLLFELLDDKFKSLVPKNVDQKIFKYSDASLNFNIDLANSYKIFLNEKIDINKKDDLKYLRFLLPVEIQCFEIKSEDENKKIEELAMKTEDIIETKNLILLIDNNKIKKSWVENFLNKSLKFENLRVLIESCKSKLGYKLGNQQKFCEISSLEKNIKENLHVKKETFVEEKQNLTELNNKNEIKAPEMQIEAANNNNLNSEIKTPKKKINDNKSNKTESYKPEIKETEKKIYDNINKRTESNNYENRQIRETHSNTSYSRTNNREYRNYDDEYSRDTNYGYDRSKNIYNDNSRSSYGNNPKNYYSKDSRSSYGNISRISDDAYGSKDFYSQDSRSYYNKDPKKYYSQDSRSSYNGNFNDYDSNLMNKNYKNVDRYSESNYPRKKNNDESLDDREFYYGDDKRRRR